jgi:hypothetical protein
LEPLEALPIPEGQDTLCEIVNAGGLRTGVTKVLRDMAYWCEISECRKKDDHLYKRTLDAVWARIKLHEHKTELIERLWEECKDSVEMCGQGHITRLANVMVGFHEGFLTPKSSKEEFQDSIAKISENKNISVKEKIQQTIILMNSINMPEEERQDWLEAIE